MKKVPFVRCVCCIIGEEKGKKGQSPKNKPPTTKIRARKKLWTHRPFSVVRKQQQTEAESRVGISVCLYGPSSLHMMESGNNLPLAAVF